MKKVKLYIDDIHTSTWDDTFKKYYLDHKGIFYVEDTADITEESVYVKVNLIYGSRGWTHHSDHINRRIEYVNNIELPMDLFEL